MIYSLDSMRYLLRVNPGKYDDIAFNQATGVCTRRRKGNWHGFECE